MTNLVDVVFNGYSYTKDLQLYANCTCTLIRLANGTNIIVDTMTAWDGDRLREALQLMFGLEPKDINYVICTHGHSDHIGCNYLFQNAISHIVGTAQSNHDIYTEITDSLTLANGEVVVTRTPGHTLSCVSVIVRNTPQGTVGICGDLFECAEDIADPSRWREAGTEDPDEQQRQRLRMVEMCSQIIPGHGPPFFVTPLVLEGLIKDIIG